MKLNKHRRREESVFGGTMMSPSFIGATHPFFSGGGKSAAHDRSSTSDGLLIYYINRTKVHEKIMKKSTKKRNRNIQKSKKTKTKISPHTVQN